MNIKTELGLRIRSYRKKKNLSQEKLAELCGLHPTYIGQLERGEKNATIESLHMVAQGLDITLSELFDNIEITSSIANKQPASDSLYKKAYALPAQKQEALLSLLECAIKLTE